MSSVQNQLVSVLESPSFPPVSTVRSGIANSPVRIYANEELRKSFLISELNLNQSLYYDVSRTILRWAKENECELVISSGSLSTQDTKEMKHSRKERQPHNLYGSLKEIDPFYNLFHYIACKPTLKKDIAVVGQ
jgi:predicted ATP-grasp superfamily ATP-dependent carboligase